MDDSDYIEYLSREEPSSVGKWKPARDSNPESSDSQSVETHRPVIRTTINPFWAESIPHININSSITTTTTEPPTAPWRRSLVHVLHDPHVETPVSPDKNISQMTSPWYTLLNGTALIFQSQS
jgi:hypothetical protein